MTKNENWCISINKPEFSSRRKRFKEFSDFHGWDVSFWDAVDCRNLKLKDYPIWSDPHLRTGEIGIWWSTKNIYEYAMKKKLDCLTIFEDDVKIISPPPKMIDIENTDYIFFNNRDLGFDGYCVTKSGMEKILDVFSRKNGAKCPIDIFVQGDPKDPRFAKYRPPFTTKRIERMVFHDNMFPTSIQETKIWPRES